MRKTLHALLGVISVGLKLPAVLLLAWGGFYIANCLHALTAPGVPVEYRYSSELGEMLVVADAYQFDLEKMEGYVQRVHVYGPDGTEVASLDSLDLLLDGDVAVIRLHDPRVRVRRLEDGTFDVLQMLPVREEEELTGGAFRLVADRAEIAYSDANVEREPIVMELTDVGVDGARGTYLFKSQFASGSMRGSAGGSFSEEGRLIADLSLDDSEMAPVLDYLRPFLSVETFDEYAFLDAESLVLDGTVRVWSDADTGTDVTGDARVVGRGLRSARTLRDATLEASVASLGRGVFIDGTIEQRGFAGDFKGTMLFGEQFRMTGEVAALARNRGDLPAALSDFVEPTLEFRNAAFVGNMDTDGSEFLFVGELTADEASFAGETTTGVVSHLRLHHEGLTARFDQGTWAGVDYTGAVAVDFESGRLSGGLQSTRGRLEPLAEHFGTDRLKGIVSVSAVLGGTLDQPVAELYARGSGGVQVVGEGPLTSIGVFEARGKLDSEGFFLERMTSNSQNGAFAAKGSMRWEDGAIALEVNGGGLDLSAFSSDLKGFGFLDARIGGTRDAPTGEGRVEVYGLEALGRTVPQFVADWTADGDRINVSRFAARAGTGDLEGAAALNLEARTIEGSFSGRNVRLEEWVHPQTVGAVTVEDGRIGGTLDEPIVSALLTAGPVYVGGIEFKSLRMEAVGGREGVRSPAFIANVDGGEIKGEGNYIFNGVGSVTATLTDLPLSKIPLSEYSLSLGGRATGDLTMSFDGTGPVDGLLSADVVDLDVNGTVVGQGWLEATMSGKTVSAEAQIGSLDRYVLLSGGLYDIETREVAGELLVYNVLIEDVIEGAGKAMATWPQSVRDLFESTTGLFNAGLTVSGSLDDPNIVVDSVVLTELEVRGRDAGVFRASGERAAGVWTLRPQEGEPMWALGDTRFSLRGTVTEEGMLGLNGDLDNFQLAWVHTLFPEVPLLGGEAVKFSFQVDGPYDDPRAHASLQTRQLGYYEDDRAINFPLEVNLDSIDVEDETVSLFGRVIYQGLEGTVEGTLPFSSFSEDPEGRSPMLVSLTFSERPFDALAPYLDLIDAERSEGTVSGFARISGLWGDLDTAAELHARGQSLALKEHGTFFRDISADAAWSNGDLVVTGSFAGEEQGSGRLALQALFPDPFAGDLNLETLSQQTRIEGEVQLTDYRLQFVLPNAESASGATITTQDLKLSGTLASPRIGGNVGLDAVYVRLPDDFAGTGSPIIYRVDPAFEGLTVTVAPGSRLVTDTARIDFFGSGRVDGSLQNPDVSLPLTVTGGRFDMPTARIALEEGGSIIVGYRSSLGTSPTARVDLNLEGHTTISARRASNEYETYQIQLLIRGNLLDEGGLNITASSDPPDLSSEQIMAVLGRKELIENFARGGSDDYLRETLYSVGLPTASNILTSGLAQQLGLDYISVDYNPFDQTIVGIGKTIGKGLMLQASRQLNANPGEPLKYEVQLTYRLPMEDAFFSRVRLSLGFDEQVPWRVKLNWARRF